MKVRQPFGDFYITSIPATKLVDICFSFPAVYGSDSLTGIQRGINEERVEKIKKFCLTENAMFPSSVILSVNYLKTGMIAEKDRWYIQQDTLYVPEKLEMASIVDGQHRIEGIKKAIESGELKGDFDIVCSLYFELPAPEQAELFSTINFNQQKVDKSLAYQLFGYDLDSKDSTYWAPDTLAIYISRLLEKEKDSPFKGKIRFGMAKEEPQDLIVKANDKDKEKSEWEISTSTIVEGVCKLISTDPTKDRYFLHKKRVIKAKRNVLIENKSNAPLRDFYLSYKDGQLYDLIVDYFSFISKNIWSQDELSFMHKTIGVQALFDLLRDIVIEIKKVKKEVDFESILPYLNRISNDKLSKLVVNFSGIGRLQIKNELRQQLEIKNRT